MSAERLIVFVKAPRLGTVKTRLGAAIGAERAREAYVTLLRTVVDRLATLPDVQVRFTPDDAREEMATWLKPRWAAEPQGGGDLGVRLHRAFADAFSAGAERVVIIGSDCPEVNAADVRNAWRELRTYDVVTGPATDGGYWLIGLRAPHPELFKGIPWSSDQVLAHTLQRAKQHNLRIQLLRILSDVDTVEDWKQFQRRNA